MCNFEISCYYTQAEGRAVDKEEMGRHWGGEGAERRWRKRNAAHGHDGQLLICKFLSQPVSLIHILVMSQSIISQPCLQDLKLSLLVYCGCGYACFTSGSVFQMTIAILTVNTCSDDSDDFSGKCSFKPIVCKSSLVANHSFLALI